MTVQASTNPEGWEAGRQEQQWTKVSLQIFICMHLAKKNKKKQFGNETTM